MAGRGEFVAYFLRLTLQLDFVKGYPQAFIKTVFYHFLWLQDDNIVTLACDGEKRLIEEKKKIECRILEIQKDKQTLTSCITAEKNKIELEKVKAVLTSTLNEVNRI